LVFFIIKKDSLKIEAAAVLILFFDNLAITNFATKQLRYDEAI
jgi:hypothetical protein